MLNLQDYYDDDSDCNNSEEGDNDGKGDDGNSGSGGDQSDDGLEDSLPWDLDWYWAKIYQTFPNLTNAQLYIQGFLDRRDQTDSQYLDISRRILAIIHTSCPDLKEFSIYCARPKCLYYGGNSVPVRLVFEWNQVQRVWAITSHAERFPLGWKQHIPGAEGYEDAEEEEEDAEEAEGE